MAAHVAYFGVGTDVSAKYRGAWCEGSIRAVDRKITVKVSFEKGYGTHTVKVEDIRGPIRQGAAVTALHPTRGKQDKGSIARITDSSSYTVRFHDGDERVLRRGAITVKGPAHYENGKTPDSGEAGGPMTPRSDFFDMKTPDSRRKRRRTSDVSNLSTPSPMVDDVRRGSTSSWRSPRQREGMSAVHIRDAPQPHGDSHQVVLVNPCNAKEEFWWPAMIVPEEEVQKSMLCGEKYDSASSMVVRFFEDNLFAIIEPQYMRVLERGTNPFVSLLQMPAFQEHRAVQRALRYIDSHELPERFKWKTWSDACDEEDGDSDGGIDGWDPNPAAEAKFHKDYTAYCERTGTKLKRTPVFGFRDLDLFRLYTLVAERGGSEQVTKANGWQEVHTTMGFDSRRGSAAASLGKTFDKHLKGYEAHKIATADEEEPPPVPAPARREPSPTPSAKSNKSAASRKLDSDDEGDDDADVEYLYEVNEVVLAMHADKEYYKAKVEKRRVHKGKQAPIHMYRVHYRGWSKRFDEWVPEKKLKLETGPARKRKATVPKKEPLPSKKKARTEANASQGGGAAAAPSAKPSSAKPGSAKAGADAPAGKAKKGTKGSKQSTAASAPAPTAPSQPNRQPGPSAVQATPDRKAREPKPPTSSSKKDGKSKKRRRSSSAKSETLAGLGGADTITKTASKPTAAAAAAASASASTAGSGGLAADGQQAEGPRKRLRTPTPTEAGVKTEPPVPAKTRPAQPAGQPSTPVAALTPRSKSKNKKKKSKPKSRPKDSPSKAAPQPVIPTRIRGIQCWARCYAWQCPSESAGPFDPTADAKGVLACYSWLCQRDTERGRVKARRAAERARRRLEQEENEVRPFTAEYDRLTDEDKLVALRAMYRKHAEAIKSLHTRRRNARKAQRRMQSAEGEGEGEGEAEGDAEAEAEAGVGQPNTTAPAMDVDGENGRAPLQNGVDPPRSATEPPDVAMVPEGPAADRGSEENGMQVDGAKQVQPGGSKSGSGGREGDGGGDGGGVSVPHRPVLDGGSNGVGGDAQVPS